MKWLRSLIAFLFPTVAATFRSDFSLPESVMRLNAAGSSWRMRADFHGTRIRLIRTDFSFFSRSRPQFTGTFHEADGEVRLVGRFAASIGAKIWDGVGLVFYALMSLGLLWITLRGRVAGWWVPALIPVLMAAGPLGIRFKQWFTYGDIDWLSGIIRQTLTSSASTSQSQQTHE